MSIQHANIPDANLHEPKGVVNAANHTVYKANGAGSGSWQQINTTDILGLTGDSGSNNKILVTNGSNGLVMKANAVYGAMTVSNNSNSFAVPAAADSSLNTTSDYVLFTGTGAPLAAENLNEITFSTNRLTLPYSGVYEIHTWANITGFPSTGAFVGMKTRTNGTTFGTRKYRVKSNVMGDSGNISTYGLHTAVAGDYLQLMFASTVAGGLTISDLNMTVRLIVQTP